jgi:putative Mn2+ efflux pump MntP
MKRILAAAAVLFPLATMAHPGHGETDGYTIIHYFTEPQHAIITFGILAAAGVFIAWERRKNSEQK